VGATKYGRSKASNQARSREVGGLLRRADGGHFPKPSLHDRADNFRVADDSPGKTNVLVTEPPGIKGTTKPDLVSNPDYGGQRLRVPGPR
jgi:hypothetical protein